jgi:hypothetical protein
MRHQHIDDDDPFDANGLLKDGRSVRISMAMRDSVLADRRKVVTRYDPRGRSEGYWEEEEDDAAHDAMRDAAMRGAPFLHDGHGNTDVVGHRPGYLVRADIANDQRRRAHDAYRHDLENAWRNPFSRPAPENRHDAEARPPTGFGSHGSRGQQEGDLCTCRGPEFVESFGAPGHLRMVEGRLVCVPDENRRSKQQQQRPDPASDAQRRADKAEMYAAYDAAKREEWRNPQ